jgi:hypothetical protein
MSIKKIQKSDQNLNLYLISDSSGETVITVAKSVMIQFNDVKVNEYVWSLVRSQKQLDQIISFIIRHPGPVLYTMGDGDLKQYFIQQCVINKIDIVCPLRPVVQMITDYLSIRPNNTGPGKYKFIDETDKINKINFAIAHDDGQQIDDYNNAEILLLGVSRTSKSPTSLYLAQRGYIVANLPIVNTITYDLTSFTKPLIVGLTINSYNLYQIRQARISQLQENDIRFNIDKYCSIDKIKDEIDYALKLYRRFNIPIIDVTNKAIEEIAAEIINTLNNFNGLHS